MKRKSPKNQRPYASPSGKKARYVDVQQPEADLIVSSSNDIGFPHIVAWNKIGSQFGTEALVVRVNADELRKWRGSRVTSEAKE